MITSNFNSFQPFIFSVSCEYPLIMERSVTHSLRGIHRGIRPFDVRIQILKRGRNIIQISIPRLGCYRSPQLRLQDQRSSSTLPTGDKKT